MQTRPISLPDLLEAVKALNTNDLEWLMPQVDAIRRQRNADDLTGAEVALLGQIKEDLLPRSVKERYDLLLHKQSIEELTFDERRELLELAQSAERMAALRITLIAQWAEIRKTSVKDLITRFGLELQPYV